MKDEASQICGAFFYVQSFFQDFAVLCRNFTYFGFTNLTDA